MSGGPGEVTDLLRALVTTPSPSGEEAAVAALFAGWLAARGGRPETDGRNVWALLAPADGDPGAPTLLLLSHLDTVPVGEGWTRPPLAAHTEPGPDGARIYGRGSNDAKGCLAAMAAAALALRDEGLPGRVLLVAAAEEETGRPGGFADLLPRLPRFDAAVVGEPTGLVPVSAQKGMLALDAVARGRQAHAARPEEGRNAVHVAARAVVALEGLRLDRPCPELGAPTAQVTVIAGGERRNVIPGSCSFSIDVRTTPAYAPEELVALIGGALGPEVELSVRSDRLRAQATDPADPILRAAAAATGREPVGSPTVSDWAHLRGTPAVKLGPGESPRSHTPDEYVTVGELERGVAVYRELARRWFAAARG